MKFGYASAIGYALTLIILALSLLQLRLLGAFKED
jgi:ABC-type sugar transport system permease subunit